MLALAVASALVLSACTGPTNDPSPSVSNQGDIDLITIEQSETLAPALVFPQDLVYPKAQTKVVWEGEGELLVRNQPLLLDVYAASLEDGAVLLNTFDNLPSPFLLAPEVVGQELYDILEGQRVGARVLFVAPAGEEGSGEPPVAMVVDVRSDRALGTEIEPREGLPSVRRLATGEPEITIKRDVVDTGELQIATLVQGSGPQVREGSQLLVNYKAVYLTEGSMEDGQSWEAGEVFETSWPPEKAPLPVRIGANAVPEGWEEGLLDQTEGSQVLLMVPQTLGYPGRGTLVFVIDILDVWNSEE
jgi:peptidylprolyl isomerase